MEELQSQELEELVQELAEEYGAPDSIPRKVRVCPKCGKHNLESAWHCGECGETLSIETLTDKEAAQAAENQTPGSEVVTRPAHLQVETRGDTLDISWKPGAEQLKDAVKSPLLVLLVSAVFLLMATSMSPGQLRNVWILVLSAVALGAGYWIAAVWVNATRIVASKGQWIFQRGPLPLPKRQFYLRPIRLDPAACRWVWMDRVEEYKLRWRSGGSGGSADGPLGCLFLIEIGILLSSIRRELVVSYKLYARCVDGGDQELLCQLSKQDAEYVSHRLEEFLDAEGGPQAEE